MMIVSAACSSAMSSSESARPYGTFDTLLETIVGQLRDKPYLLGDRISAADILWGNALRWGMMFKLVPEECDLTGRETQHAA